MPFNNNPYGQQPEPQNPSELFPSLWGSQEDVDSATNTILARVFMRMFVALVVTAFVSLIIQVSTPLRDMLLWYPQIAFGAMIASVGVVFIMSFAMMKMSAATANVMFFVYSILMGVALSSIFIIYTTGVIVQAFVIAAVMFAAMALYGTIAKRDLTRIGSLLFMGLVGIIIASFINLIFFRDDMISLAISYIGVVIFLGLTAYDTQRIKNMITSVNSGGEDCVMAGSREEAIKKISIYGALSLYLNFINIFLKLLRIFSRR